MVDNGKCIGTCRYQPKNRNSYAIIIMPDDIKAYLESEINRCYSIYAPAVKQWIENWNEQDHNVKMGF